MRCRFTSSFLFPFRTVSRRHIIDHVRRKHTSAIPHASHPATAAIAFDMDGVLIRGGKAIPGARRAIERLRGDNPKNTKVPFIVLTNAGGESEESKAKKLSGKLGIEIKASEMILSHTPKRHLAPLYKNKLVLVVGPEDVKQVALSYGFTDVITSREMRNWGRCMWPYRVQGDEHPATKPAYDLSTTPISAILIMNDSPDWGLDIQLITDVLASQGGNITTRQNPHEGIKPVVPLYSSNADFLWTNEWPWPRYGQGGFHRALEGVWKHLTKSPLPVTTQFGKPTKPTYDYAKDHLHKISGRRVEKVYALGDNPASDIAGANRHGWIGVLVETGVFRPGTPLPVTEKPEVIVKNVEEGIEWILRKEGILA